jgi:hypothetical protein
MRSSDFTSEQRLAGGSASSRSIEENLHCPSLIAEGRKFGKVRRWVFRVSMGL